MSHGNSAGLPSTTLMFTSGTESRTFRSFNDRLYDALIPIGNSERLRGYD